MISRLTIRHPGRAAAVVGAAVAVGATALMALGAGTASADEPGRCVENVNVRSEPDVTSRIVALCEAGTEVKVGETRNGFVHLTDLGGWSAQEYVSVNGATPAAARPAGDDAADSTSTTSSSQAPSDRRAPAATTTPAAPARSSGDDAAADDADVTAQPAPATGRTFPRRTPAPAPAPEPAESSPAGGGLLG